MIYTIKQTILKHGYLLLIAIWLYTISLIVTQYTTNSFSLKKTQSFLTEQLQLKEKDVYTLTEDTIFLQNVLSNKRIESEQIKLTQKPYGIFVYELNDSSNPSLLYWNSNKYSIAKTDVLSNDGSHYVNYQNGSFEIIKKTTVVNSRTTIFIGIVPIRWNYFLENKYLKSYFADNADIENYYEISNNENATPILNILGQKIYAIERKQDIPKQGYNWATIITRSFAILFLLIFINAISAEVVLRNGIKKGFSFLLIAVFILRLLSYLFPFPFEFGKLPLFDAAIYASNNIHPSLGDLLINAILVFWLVIFYKFSSANHTPKLLKKTSTIQAYFAIGMYTFITFFLANIIRSLVLDSKISFDVSNFFSLNIYSVVSFIILCFCSLIFYHLSHILFSFLLKSKLALFQIVAAIAVFGLCYLSFKTNDAFTTSNLLVLSWLIVYSIILYYRKQDIYISLIKSSFFIFWMVFFAISIAFLVVQQNNFIEYQQRKKWAEKLNEQADPDSENLLKIATTNFNDAFLSTNFYRFKQEFSNKFIKDSLVNENFSGYLNKYETRIYLFDNLFKPLFNDDSASYAAINTIILNQGKGTSIDNLFSYKNNNEKESFLYRKIIKYQDSTQGFLFVTVNPKRYKSESLYPELFRQTQDVSTDFNTNYAYAIYTNGKLNNRFNDYNFPSSLANIKLPSVKFEQRNTNNYTELWYNTGTGKVIVIARKETLTFEIITLFAYIFFTNILVLALFHSGSFFLQHSFKKNSIEKVFQLKIRTQIHATIIFISFFSFVIIGIATISFFIYRFNQSNEDRLSKSIQVMANAIEEKMNTIKSQLAFDDVLTINDIGFSSNIEKNINEVAEIHNVDVNLFNTNGKLIASTQPYIYNKHLLTDVMEPNAFYELTKKKSIRFIQEEKISQFNYLSIYIPIDDEAGNTYAYLNIPYLNSQAELNQEISGFLATLINLNAFIFLLAGAIAYLATERITASFSLISEKMKAVNIDTHNEAIEWNRKDEIGVLVTEYNKMVQKLEQSAKALAQSEREGAWREMARQVAHEIKNPLTPMKLSIQYLQKATNNNTLNIKELTQKVTTTLIEQIEQLSKIAGDFAQFANIGNTHVETFNLTDVLQSLIQLYSTQEKVNIVYNLPKAKSFIHADKIQISRLFANLILNAIEACEEKEIAKISINQTFEDNHVVLKITDDGTGIPEEIKNKIFIPNFTTKTSGTGLGLAICKGIVEKANGSIYFTTEANKGTTFVVSLPLVKV